MMNSSVIAPSPGWIEANESDVFCTRSGCRKMTKDSLAMAMSDGEASPSRGRRSGRPPAAAPRTALDAVTARRLGAATTSMSAGAWRLKPGGRGIRRTTEMSGDPRSASPSREQARPPSPEPERGMEPPGH
ncbi:hypothetical protein C2845_PM12G01920 [Panicum miliaceum]|uniref:Uncharacterized protein n=1 Tax=Panicum miliaceum TaxID=4540 RepID=A0A3L6QIE9_PANMI|nr:hypothetical protein C2845_PM12G01920 [Panicum miliaceum]